MTGLTADARFLIARAKSNLAGWQPCESAQGWVFKSERPAVLLLRLAREARAGPKQKGKNKEVSKRRIAFVFRSKRIFKPIVIGSGKK